ncbi:MAG TPA: hypothetical protein VGD78_18430 [Chthoniobacterales bacterium]
MKAIRVEQQGGPEALKLVEVAPPRHRAQATRRPSFRAREGKVHPQAGPKWF